jgi:hypothetical protein
MNDPGAVRDMRTARFAGGDYVGRRIALMLEHDRFLDAFGLPDDGKWLSPHQGCVTVVRTSGVLVSHASRVC